VGRSLARPSQREDRTPTGSPLTERRIVDLKRIAYHRFGKPFPEGDDFIQEHIDAILQHLAWCPHPADRMRTFRDAYCPWLPDAEIHRHVMCPTTRLPSADDLGSKPVLSREERERLAIATIGWAGSTREERKAASHTGRRARQLVKLQERRRREGVRPRAQYEALSAGMSRAKWYRLRKEESLTSDRVQTPDKLAA
jgi:hypothetical protein